MSDLFNAKNLILVFQIMDHSKNYALFEKSHSRGHGDAARGVECETA